MRRARQRGRGVCGSKMATVEPQAAPARPSNNNEIRNVGNMITFLETSSEQLRNKAKSQLRVGNKNEAIKTLRIKNRTNKMLSRKRNRLEMLRKRKNNITRGTSVFQRNLSRVSNENIRADLNELVINMEKNKNQANTPAS